MEGSTRISGASGTDIGSAYIIINEWIADLWTYAPPPLRASVDVMTTGLTDVSKNLQMGNISSNEAFKNAIMAVLATSDAQAIGSYFTANCPPQ
jgi:hypothetical protein